jgi:signal peptidase I
MEDTLAGRLDTPIPVDSDSDDLVGGSALEPRTGDSSSQPVDEPPTAEPSWQQGPSGAAVLADAPPDLLEEQIRRPAVWRRFAAELGAGVQTLFSAAVYATLIVTFGFQVARVDGLSMAPTLEDHDRLIVNKLVYELGDPRPGDIVMLYYPLNPDKMFVKRVIAREGDVVRIVDGHVYVNDVPLHDDYVPEEFRSHDDWGPQVVQQGYYFVMGDHRNNSSDSRHWGQVPKKYIVGKVKLRWWPLQDARIF